ncbi:hypothetical protein PG990_003279 [Apiospora arundinis]
MADPLSMGASIIAFVEITNRIIGTCKYCIETIKDAPKDFQMILGETTSLEAIIETLRTSNVKPLGLSVTLEACHRCLASLEGLLPKTKEKYRSGRRRDKISFAELAWPLKESKARKLLSEVSQHKATLLLAISGDMAHDIKAIRAGINNVEESLSDAERLQISCWLETINPSTLHNQAWQKHHEATTSWLLRLFYIVVDAVDESSPRSDLVALLATIALDQRFGNVRLLFLALKECFGGQSVRFMPSNVFAPSHKYLKLSRIFPRIMLRLISAYFGKYPRQIDRLYDAFLSG